MAERYVREMQDLFDDKRVARCVVGVTDWFSVGVDSALSSFLFAVVIEVDR